MDLLDWTKLHPDIKVAFTKKKYFNEYNYKLTYCVPGARLLTYKCPTEFALMQRVNSYNSRSNNFTHGMVLWAPRWYRETADFDQLRSFYEVYNNIKDGAKLRVEQDTLNIYSDSEAYLYRIANTMLGDQKACLREICKPESANAKHMLNQGFTLVKKQPTHPYRLRIRDGFQYAAERKCLADYLKNLNDDVKISEYMLARLGDGHKYFNGGYVYLKDPRIVDVLILVAPNLIGTVNQLIINN